MVGAAQLCSKDGGWTNHVPSTQIRDGGIGPWVGGIFDNASTSQGGECLDQGEQNGGAVQLCSKDGGWTNHVASAQVKDGEVGPKVGLINDYASTSQGGDCLD